MIINPSVYIGFIDWANQLWVSTKNHEIPIPLDENEWREWVMTLNSIKEFGIIPDPCLFDNWREWALAFLISLPTDIRDN